MSPEETFSAALRRARRDLGLSQTWVAAEMSARGFPWHQATAARTEAGQRPIRLNEAVALAGVLRVDFAELLAGHLGQEMDQAAENAALRRTLAVIRVALDGAEAGS